MNYEELQKHKHIVICGDSAKYLGVIRSIQEGGLSPIVIYATGHKETSLVLRSKYVTKVHICQDYEDAIGFVIKNYSNETDKPFLYVSDDYCQSVVDNYYDKLCDKFYFFHAGAQGVINKLMSKQRLCELATSCGFSVPSGITLRKGDINSEIKFPLITKVPYSIVGGWKNDVFVCNNEEDLKLAYSKIQSDTIILQEYIHKKNEVAIMGYSINGGREVCMPFQLSYFRSSNSAYGHYMYFREFNNTELFAKIQA